LPITIVTEIRILKTRLPKRRFPKTPKDYSNKKPLQNCFKTNKTKCNNKFWQLAS
jgi:hypothetical protein